MRARYIGKNIACRMGFSFTMILPVPGSTRTSAREVFRLPKPLLHREVSPEIEDVELVHFDVVVDVSLVQGRKREVKVGFILLLSVGPQMIVDVVLEVWVLLQGVEQGDLRPLVRPQGGVRVVGLLVVELHLVVDTVDLRPSMHPEKLVPPRDHGPLPPEDLL